MMSNSNYNIGLQRLKPVYTAYWVLHNLAENWSWTRDVNGRDRDETETLTIFLETRRWYVSRPSRDRDVETETTTLHQSSYYCGSKSAIRSPHLRRRGRRTQYSQ